MLVASIFLLIGLAAFVIFTGVIIYRLALFLFTRYIQRKFNIKVRIGTLKFLKFLSVQDLYVQLKNGTVVQAERLWVSSCIFSSEYSSLVALCCSEVRLQINLDGLFDQNDTDRTSESVDGLRHRRAPAWRETSTSLVTALKNISLHLYAIDIMLFDGKSDSLVHTTFKELTLNAYSKGKDACAVTASVSSAALRIFRQPPDRKRDTCLANACVDAECRLSLLLSPQPVVLKSLEMEIRNPVLTISENLQIPTIFTKRKRRRDPHGKDARWTSESNEIAVTDARVFGASCRADGDGSSSPSPDLTRKMHRLMLRLPRKVNFTISMLSFKVMKEQWVPGLTFELDQFTGSLCNDSGAVSGNVCVRSVRFSSEASRLASLALVEIETTLENYCDLSVALKIQSLHTNYDREEMHYWLTGIGLFNPATSISSDHMARTVEASVQPKIESAEDYGSGATKGETYKAREGLLRTVNVSLQVTDLMISLSTGGIHFHTDSQTQSESHSSQLRPPNLNAGVSRFTVELDLRRSDLDGASYWESKAELMMAMGVCALEAFPTIQASSLKKFHAWNMPLAFGMCVLQMRDCGREFHLEGSMNDIHVETTHELLQLLYDLQIHLRSRRAQARTAAVSSEASVVNGTKRRADSRQASPADTHRDIDNTYKDCGAASVSNQKRRRVELTLTNGNLFSRNSVGHCVALRIDTLMLTADHRRSYKCVAEHSALRLVRPEGHLFPVCAAQQMAERCAYVKTMTFKRRHAETSIEFAEVSRLWWTPTAYKHVITLINDTRAVLRSASQSEKEYPSNSDAEKPRPWGFRMIFRGDSILEFQLSERHTMYIIGNDFIWKRRPNEARVTSERLVWRFDEHDVFTFEKIAYLLNPPNEESRMLRRHFYSTGMLGLERNRRWQLSFGRISVGFPHDYNFAEAFSEDFVCCFKWLKLVHGKKLRTAFTVDSILPADLTISVGVISLEIQDDPFEVKLRQNYQLLEDEYIESCKRRQTLDQKIEVLRKTNVLISDATIAELNQGLDKMNAEQYINRSRKLFESSRQSLVKWIWTDFEFSAMADPKFHGKDRVVALINKFNPNSPLPDDTEFATLWCRVLNGNCKNLECSLRDFPQKLLKVNEFFWFGQVVGAEQEGTARAKRTCILKLEPPFACCPIERNMPPLKLFYDITFDINTYVWVYGSCWEPVLAQVNLALDLINKPSTDPSPPLPWWDKARLLTHGKLTVSARRLSYLQHGSLSPYNSTEMLDTTWTNAMLYWYNGRIICQGDLDQHIYAASRYHASHLLHFPNLKLSVKLTWRCIGNPFDHHSVMPCASDKLPEYSIHQRHDSYRAFRSTSLDASIALETRAIAVHLLPESPVIAPFASLLSASAEEGAALVGPDGNYETRLSSAAGEAQDVSVGVCVPSSFSSPYESAQRQLDADDNYATPRLQLYSATIRWLENFRTIVTGPPKLTRRGPLFGSGRQRKTHLSRHFHSVAATISLHRFRVACWTSLARHAGFQLDSGRLQLSCEHHLTLVAVRDDFHQIRHKPNWSTAYMNCELSDSSHIWLYHAEDDSSEPRRRYFLSVSCVSYGRETKLQNIPEAAHDETPLHRLAVHGLKGAWTKHNRDVVFGLFDTFINAVNLRRNMTNEALKPFKMDQASKSSASRKVSSPSQTPSTSIAPGNSIANTSASRLASSRAFSMLEKLIAESAEHKLVFTEAVETAEPVNLTGVKECQLDDVLSHNWLIELRNSQVMLRGCDSPGYVILSAAKAQILQRLHVPVWKDNNLVAKTTWKGTLDCMQYYATVENTTGTACETDIQWLTTEHIEARDTDITDYADIVGSGHSVGGVVSADVGAGTADGATGTRRAQLQRIISRCGCQFFYASFGEQGIDPATLDEVPPLPEDKDPDDPWEHEVAVDSFTLIHHDLQVCTNPLQYSMILDLVNNLLLYVEPRRKEANERLQRMRFMSQLEQDKDQKGSIISLQNQARELIALHKELEKKAFAAQRRLELSEYSSEDEDLRDRLTLLEQEILAVKKQLHSTSEDLTLMVNCYRETQVAAWKSQRQQLEHSKISTVRRSEVSFKHALWKLTDEDGQLGIAELVLCNFLYSRTTKSNDSVEHLLELGNIKVTNENPNDVYRDVLQPTEVPSHVPVERQRALRLFCRVRAPVGGISIKEHLEVNLVPISICLTHTLTRRLLTFFFSRKEAEKAVDGDDAAIPVKEPTRKKERRKVDRNNPVDHDDIEKMKERAANNQTFLYIKIPEVPMRLTYKGEKEKKNIIRDLIDYSLVLPTIELHNRTCTWLDLLIIIKNTARTALVSQAIRQKLQIKSTTTTTTASILLPTRLLTSTPTTADSSSASSGSATSPKQPPPEVRYETSEEQARLLLFGAMGQGELKKEKRGFFK